MYEVNLISKDNWELIHQVKINFKPKTGEFFYLKESDTYYFVDVVIHAEEKRKNLFSRLLFGNKIVTSLVCVKYDNFPEKK
tara:strand:+ start:333 stop:575 length:243 start_codon:yes stop_codon:yes gene_type:complete